MSFIISCSEPFWIEQDINLNLNNNSSYNNIFDPVLFIYQKKTSDMHFPRMQQQLNKKKCSKTLSAKPEPKMAPLSFFLMVTLPVLFKLCPSFTYFCPLLLFFLEAYLSTPEIPSKSPPLTSFKCVRVLARDFGFGSEKCLLLKGSCYYFTFWLELIRIFF